MNCSEFEKRIYLYEELNPSERRTVDDHKNQCEACRTLADQFFRTQGLIEIAKDVKQRPQNSHLLTQRIITAIEKEKGVTFIHVLASYLDSFAIRYAVSAISIFLILFFIYEQQVTDYTSSAKLNTREIKEGAVLDMSKFINTYVKRREEKRERADQKSSTYTYYKSERAEKNL